MAGQARYRVETPDGQTFEIDGPEGASEDQLNELVRGSLQGKFAANPINRTAPKVADPEDELIGDIGAGVSELGTGFAEGASHVLDQAADWTQAGLNGIGEFTGIGRIGDALNSVGAEDSQPVQNELASTFAPPRSGLDTLRGVGQFGGEVAATLPLAAVRGGAMVQGALGGALLSDPRDPMAALMNAGIGAVGGQAIQSVMRGAAGAAAPTVSRDARALLDEGQGVAEDAIRLTPGMIAGPGSTTKRIEDIAASVPLVGGPVAAAQRRAVEDVNRAAVRRPLRMIGERLPRDVEAGHDAIAYTGDKLRAAYGDVLPRLNGSLDQTFQTRVNTIRQRANLPAEYDRLLDQAQSELGNAFTGAGQNGSYSGRTLRDASDRLDKLAAGWRANTQDPYIRQVGEVAGEFRQQLHALARRQNPADATRLRNIDRAYASLVRVERGALNTADGVMTPAQYDAGVRGADRSTRKRSVSRGEALDQDLSGAARRTMQNTAAQGGSKDVNSLIALGALGTGVAGLQPTALAAAAGIGVGRAAYSESGQAAIRAIMSRNPGVTARGAAAILRAGSEIAPVVAPAAIEQFR